MGQGALNELPRHESGLGGIGFVADRRGRVEQLHDVRR
jgi:hypothetical protein